MLLDAFRTVISPILQAVKRGTRALSPTMFRTQRRCCIPHRQEQETYIAELENQNRVPAGKDVVHPLAGFVIKAKFSRNSQDSREKARPERHMELSRSVCGNRMLAP